MLYLAPEYEANFGKFVMALHQGHSAAEAFETAWGRSGADAFADLHFILPEEDYTGGRLKSSWIKRRKHAGFECAGV